MTTNRYLVALVDGGGTVPVELGVVGRLVERGHDVVVLAEDSMAKEVEATGAAFRRWVTAPNRPDRRPENDPYRDWECKNPRQLFARLLESQFAGPLRAYAADTEAAIVDHQPDLVVCSQFAFGAMVAAEVANVPFDVLIPNIYLFPFEGSTPFGLGLRSGRNIVGRSRDRLLRSMLHRMWDKGLARLNGLRTERGLTPLGHFLDQPQQARRQLVLTSSAFDFPQPPTLPASVRYVGPVLDDPSWADDVTERGHRRPATSRSSSLDCRRPSRIMSPRCNESSTPWRRCRCVASSPLGPPSSPDRCRRRTTSRSSPARRIVPCSNTPPSP